MKRFKLVWGRYPNKKTATVKVDDKDAHLLREHPYYSVHGSADPTDYIVRHDTTGSVVFLSHDIIGRPEGGKKVMHANGDQMDFRRSNLQVVVNGAQGHPMRELHRLFKTERSTK